MVIELHTDAENLAKTILTEVPLFEGDQPLWGSGADTAGLVDVAAVELHRASMPPDIVIRAFNEGHLVREYEQIEIGVPVLIVGFPLGFHDTLHHLAVARQAVVASAFGIRFQVLGYFLTDAQTQRGSRGAPVVARTAARQAGRSELAWKSLGIHASRMDVSNRDVNQDAFLSLNCAWYADVLPSLTK